MSRRADTLAVLALVAALVLGGPLPAGAHTGHDLDRWLQEWETASIQPDLTPTAVMALAVELADMTERHPWYFDPEWSPPPPATPGSSEAPSPKPDPGPSVSAGKGTERWRDLVATYFRPEDVDRALCLMGFESGGDPSARNPSGAAGLFQIMPFWFDAYGGQWDDPVDNTRLAAIIRDEQGWTAWDPYKRGECR